MRAEVNAPMTAHQIVPLASRQQQLRVAVGSHLLLLALSARSAFVAMAMQMLHEGTRFCRAAWHEFWREFRDDKRYSMLGQELCSAQQDAVIEPLRSGQPGPLRCAYRTCYSKGGPISREPEYPP